MELIHNGCAGSTGNTVTYELLIKKLPAGGYLVTDVPYHNGSYINQMFACTTIGEVLAFVNNKLEPKEPKKRNG